MTAGADGDGWHVELRLPPPAAPRVAVGDVK